MTLIPELRKQKTESVSVKILVLSCLSLGAMRGYLDFLSSDTAQLEHLKRTERCSAPAETVHHFHS